MKIHACDCLEVLRKLPDNYADLLLTDPPYGDYMDIISGQQRDHYDKSWNKELSDEYIKEMLRVSKNQVIFGGEHLSNRLPRSRGWVVWDKRITNQESNEFGDCELIWTSFNKPCRIIRHLWNGFRMKIPEKRYKHPTQKPLGVINELLKRFSQENELILDPFAGTGTTAVACNALNRRWELCESNKEYVKIINTRLKQRTL